MINMCRVEQTFDGPPEFFDDLIKPFLLVAQISAAIKPTRSIFVASPQRSAAESL